MRLPGTGSQFVHMCALALCGMLLLPNGTAAQVQMQMQAPTCVANSDGSVTCSYSSGAAPAPSYPAGQQAPVMPQAVTPQTVMRQAVTPQPAMPQAVMPQVAMPQAVMPQAMTSVVPGAAGAGGTDCNSSRKGLGSLFKGKVGKILGGAMSALCVTGQVAAVAQQAQAGTAAQPTFPNAQGLQSIVPAQQAALPGMAMPGAIPGMQATGMVPQAAMVPQGMAAGAGNNPCAGLMSNLGEGMDSKGARIFGSALQMMCTMGQPGATGQQQQAPVAMPNNDALLAGTAYPGAAPVNNNDALLAGTTYPGAGYPGAMPNAQPYPATPHYPGAAMASATPAAAGLQPQMAYPGATADPGLQARPATASLPPEVDALSLPVNGISDIGG